MIHNTSKEHFITAAAIDKASFQISVMFNSTCTNLGRNKLPEEFDPMCLHVISCTVGHVLIESSQQNGANHDGHIQPQTGQKTTALQSHIRRSDDESLPGTVGQWEQVITANNTQNQWGHNTDGSRFLKCRQKFRHIQFNLINAAKEKSQYTENRRGLSLAKHLPLTSLSDKRWMNHKKKKSQTRVIKEHTCIQFKGLLRQGTNSIWK